MFDYTEDWEHQATDTDEQDDSTFKSPRFIDSPNSKLQEFNTKISAPPVLKKSISILT